MGGSDRKSRTIVWTYVTVAFVWGMLFFLVLLNLVLWVGK
jgi:hypothetical protein